MRKPRHKSRKRSKPAGTSTKARKIELLVILLGLTLVGFCYWWVLAPEKAPKLELEIGKSSLATTGDGYAVPVTVSNSGNAAAFEVEISVSLLLGETHQEASVTVAEVKPLEKVSTEVIFGIDPELAHSAVAQVKQFRSTRNE